MCPKTICSEKYIRMKNSFKEFIFHKKKHQIKSDRMKMYYLEVFFYCSTSAAKKLSIVEGGKRKMLSCLFFSVC